MVMRRTSELYAQQVADVNGIFRSQKAREKEAQSLGLNLSHDGKSALNTAVHHIPRIKDRFMDTIIIDVAHDELLGSWPQQVYLNLFAYTRDKSNPNYFGLTKLQERGEKYDWKGSCK
jgi:hypothetical protein